MHNVSSNWYGWPEGARKLYDRIGVGKGGKAEGALFHEARWWDEYQAGMLPEEWGGEEEKKGGIGWQRRSRWSREGASELILRRVLYWEAIKRERVTSEACALVLVPNANLHQ